MHPAAAAEISAAEGLPAEAEPGSYHVVELGAGVPVVFLPDVAMTAAAFDSVAERLAEDYWTVAVDLPGHGRSGPLTEGSGFDDVVADLGLLLGDLGVVPAHVVGHGTGGALALALTLDFPDAVSSLTLVAADVSAEPRPGDLDAGLAAWGSGDREFVDLVFPQLFSPGSFTAQPGLVVGERARWDALRAALVVPLWAALARRPDLAERLGEIACPLLVVGGADDEIVAPERLGALAAAVPGAGLVVVPAAGHAVVLEQPAAVVGALRPFLDRLA